MNEWCPFAVSLPGPINKQGYDINTRIGKGAIIHSAEGEWPGMLGRLESTAQVSWHFSILQRGVVVQAYPLSAICWHGGSPYPNKRWVGIECEGRAGDPVSGVQLDALVGLLLWMDEQEQWPSFIHDRGGPILEHNWFYATACPSGRIPWEEVIDMAMLFQELKARLSALERYRGLTQAVFDNHEHRLNICTEYRIITQAVLDEHERRVKKLERAAPK